MSIVSPIIPNSFAELGARQDNVALLRKAGVVVAIIGNAGGDEEAFNVRNIRFEAGSAVSYGADRNHAPRAITLRQDLLEQRYKNLPPNYRKP